MNIYLILIAGICYLITAWGSVTQKDYAHALMYVSYFTANLGLIWHEMVK